MKRLILFTLLIFSAILIQAQTQKMFWEIPSRTHTFTVAIPQDAVVFQKDSARWMKITHRLEPKWRFDTVYKAGWWMPTEERGFADPTTTRGDIIYNDGSITPG